MKTTFLLTTLLLLTILGLTPTWAETEPKQSATLGNASDYSQEFVADYMNSCTKKAATRGLPPEMAPELCSCTIAKFQAQYTVDEFVQLRQQADENEPEVVDNFLEVGFECLESMLYEE